MASCSALAMRLSPLLCSDGQMIAMQMCGWNLRGATKKFVILLRVRRPSSKTPNVRGHGSLGTLTMV